MEDLHFKGTKDEWLVKTAHDVEIVGDVHIIHTADRYHLAYVSGWTDNDEAAEEAEANALLMSMSPLLLEALRRCESALSNIPLPVEFVNDLLNAREVIEKSLR